MITLPTTEQIILDCRRELLDTVLPAVSDPAVRVTVEMMENVLRNVATRCAHEIAWMAEEAEVMMAFAAEVAKVAASDALLRAIEEATLGRRTSLELDDVIREYSLAGEALSCAIEAAFEVNDDALLRKAVEILQARNAREQQIKGEWAMIGRG
ncbi:MAG: hypothetical protein ACP5P1_03240 [Acidimicrobiales bacterium]